MNRILFLMMTALMLWASDASATVWATLVPAQSRVIFVSRQMGVDVPGKFGSFTAQIAFDPAAPQTGHAQISIATASADAGGVEANGMLQDKDWFDVREYPQASFVSNGLVALGGGRYRASGNLTLKGKTRPLLVPFSATQTAAGLVLEGDLPISRAAYGIGAGEWADPSVVADEVRVHFHLVLK